MTLAARKQKKVVALEPIPKQVPLWSFDVSSSAIGWAQFFGGRVNDFGVIKSPASWDSRKRIAANTAALASLIQERRPLTVPWSAAVMEWNSHKKAGRCINAQGLAVLGQSQGAVWHMLISHDLIGVVDQISERDWTKQGGRNVKKTTRYEQALVLFPDYARMLRDDPNADDGMDISDALMLAEWRLAIK